MTKNKKGFTIIEVVLVLAIAGLIFLMVFIALPALQRSQRNTRRRQDMARILSAFTEYASNNGGKMPESGNLDNFVQKYVGAADQTAAGGRKTSGKTGCDGDQFCDPDGTPYKIKLDATFSQSSHFQDNSSLTFPNDHQILYYRGAVCSSDTEGKVAYSGGGQNNVALQYVLEGGAIYCGDNQ